MKRPEQNFLPYSKLRMQTQSGIFRQNEIPVEHAISLPIPTLRFGAPGYAVFAAPAIRKPGEATRQLPPDRWWILDGVSAHILVYAQTKSLPLSAEASFEEIEIPPTTRTIREMKTQLEEIEKLMDEVAPDFFSGEPAQSNLKDQLKKHLNDSLPSQAIGIYRAIAPDFFQWLDQPAKG